VTAAPAGRTLRLAHRGDWRVAPENTIEAMLAALAIPACDGLEFDVRASADGVPVLLHDATLARVQGVDAAVGDLTAIELRAHGIPSLAEALAAAGRNPFLDIELKGHAVPAVIDVLEEGRGSSLRHSVVSSFDAATLRWVHDRRPSWPTWLNASSLSALNLATARELGCVGVSAEWTTIDADGIARARSEGLETAAWTVREPDEYRQLEELCVRAVCVEAAALDG
jgi:glycerophosphoryl diester phosphodiesterase